MMHPGTELAYINEQVGLGVVARQRLPRGTIVWVQDPMDHVFTDAQFSAMPSLLRGTLWRHVFRQDGVWVLTWDHGRYTNHSCGPNCAGFGGAFDVVVRDIEAGEQLTNDYGYIGVADAFDCRCGDSACRGRIDGSVRSEASGGALHSAYAEAMAAVLRVVQPLWPIVEPGDSGGLGALRRKGLLAAAGGTLTE